MFNCKWGIYISLDLAIHSNKYMIVYLAIPWWSHLLRLTGTIVEFIPKGIMYWILSQRHTIDGMRWVICYVMFAPSHEFNGKITSKDVQMKYYIFHCIKYFLHMHNKCDNTKPVKALNIVVFLPLYLQKSEKEYIHGNANCSL